MRGRLLDTTRRNRLLNYRESARDIPVIDEMPNRVFDALYREEGHFFFQHIDRKEEEDDPSRETEPDRALPESRSVEDDLEARYTDKHLQTPFSERELEKRLRKLYLEHRSLIAETGANGLFLAIGFLHWKDPKDEHNEIKSPLILLPVQLEKEKGYGPAAYRLSFDDEALDSNFSLIEKLKHDFVISLPPVTDEIEPERYWRDVNGAIASREADGWHVVREMSLGLFRFYKQVMWHDLDPERWPSYAPLTDKAIVRRLLLGPQESDSQPGLIQDEHTEDGENEDLPLVLDADSSQFSAVVDTLRDKDSLIVEGPPGTGKSQTIVNLIAAALSEGKSILFVAEKMAALEVVFRRLDRVALGDFCLELHGLKTSKKELLESIRKRIDKYCVVPAALAQRREELRASREDLLAVSKSLSRRLGPEQLPLYDVIWRVERLSTELPAGFKPITFDGLANLNYESFFRSKNLLNDLAHEWGQIRSDARIAWKGFLPDATPGDGYAEINSVIHGTKQAAKKAQDWFAAHGIDSSAPSLTEVLRLDQLGKLSTEEHFPSFPFGSLLELAHIIAKQGNIDEYHSFVQQVSQYLEHVADVREVFDYQDENAGEYAEILATHCNPLAQNLFSPKSILADLPAKREDVDRLLRSLDSLPATAGAITSLLNGPLRTILDYERACENVDKYIGGPKELMLHAHAKHADSAAPALLRDVRRQCRRLVKQMKEQLSAFRMDSTADTKSIQEAYAQLNANRDRWLPPIGREYRASRRVIRSLLKNRKGYSRKTEFVESVAGLVDFCTARDRFSGKSNTLAFGSLFDGLDTNWDQLESLVDFSQMLRKDLGLDRSQEILSEWSAHYDRVSESMRKVSEVLATAQQFSEEYGFPESLWMRPIVAIAETIRPWKGRIDAAIRDISGEWCSTHVSLQRIQNAIDHFHQAKALESRLEEAPEFAQMLKPAWNRTATNLEALRQVETWFAERFDTTGVNSELLRVWFPRPDSDHREDIVKIIQVATGFRKHIRASILQLEEAGKVEWADWLGTPSSRLRDLVAKLESCLATQDYLPLLERWSRAHAECLKNEMGEFSRAICEEILVGEKAGQALEYSVYKVLLQKAIEADPKLSNFSSTRHEGLRHRFCHLDQEVLTLNADEIASNQCRRYAPPGNRSGRVGDYTEKALLVHEAGKTRRHIPIRQLVKRAPNALQVLKPCFLMSPLSVAQYLPRGDIDFDLVIMDEASQIRPEDALGAIARARKAIIVGDPKQLPPTSFFQGAVIEDEDAEETIADDAESILDVCLKQFPYRRLRWHYRSNHEDLIRFSNEQFYDGDLFVFPSSRGTNRELGVHFTKIKDPSYKSGRNRNEANVVVENIVRHFQQFPGKSLGVAALNRRQAEDIQNLLDSRRKQDFELDSLITEFAEENPAEPLFIKNLENVQGDERDVIFISITYGPENPGDRTFQRFGPINSELGWRRLNVIATRAKERVEVFSSMEPSDILVGEKSKKGVRVLREYLEYVKTGRIPERALQGGAPESDFEETVGKAINDLGYEPIFQVGVAGFYIDIGVIHPDRPGEYLMGIECDGAAYHSAQFVRDRDRLRQEILESKGWAIHRIWSTNWFYARIPEINRLKSVLAEKLKFDRAKAATDLEPKEDNPVVQTSPSLEGDGEAQALDEKTLREALNRYWESNIAPISPDRTRSILSSEIVNRIVALKPETKQEWLHSVPITMRQRIEASQGQFLDDILEIVLEHA